MTQPTRPRLIVTRAPSGIITRLELEGIEINERGRIEIPASSVQITDKVQSLPIVGIEFHTGYHFNLVTITEGESG